MQSIGQLQLDEFLNELSSSNFPSPASGSAAATAAAMAAALLEMACKVTMKKSG